MENRSLLLLHHGLALHCSTARIRPTSPLIKLYLNQGIRMYVLVCFKATYWISSYKSKQTIQFKVRVNFKFITQGLSMQVFFILNRHIQPDQLLFLHLTKCEVFLKSMQTDQVHFRLSDQNVRNSQYYFVRISDILIN